MHIIYWNGQSQFQCKVTCCPSFFKRVGFWPGEKKANQMAHLLYMKNERNPNDGRGQYYHKKVGNRQPGSYGFYIGITVL